MKPAVIMLAYIRSREEMQATLDAVIHQSHLMIDLWYDEATMVNRLRLILDLHFAIFLKGFNPPPMEQLK